LRAGSREHYEAIGRARYVVTNDHLPDWFVRRPDQVCLQTWHGTALKRLGLDVAAQRGTARHLRRRWFGHAADWQYLVAPNRFSSPIFRRAYALEGKVLETGLPRADVLTGPGRDEAGRRVRSRLGIAEDARVVLYAPTYRDHIVDSKGRYRLDLQLDFERLAGAVGDDTVLLFRRHPAIADSLPPRAARFARDVSSYPEATELLLAVDVLITDYSSCMFDFANTGRPMLFFAYDLDDYQESIRGFNLDYAETVPGPVLGTTDEVAAALADLDGIRTAHAQRYEAFRSAFCEFDDGGATARVVDRVFGAPDL
jgi:CDP-glycerol glycerophosphotransferase